MPRYEIKASNLRAGDVLLEGYYRGCRIVACEEKRDDDLDEPYMLVDFGDSRYDEFKFNLDAKVQIEGNMPEWERELLASSRHPLGPPDIKAMVIGGDPYTYPYTSYNLSQSEEAFNMLKQHLKRNTHPNAPGGNHMSRSTRDVDSRLDQLNSTVASATREIRFLESLPAEPDVDTESVEPTVLLFNKLHPDTGKVVKSTVVRSSTSRRNGEVVGWTTTDEGYAQDWVTAVRQAFDCNSDFEIRQLNPGTVVYTTVPAPAKATRKRTTT